MAKVKKTAISDQKLDNQEINPEVDETKNRLARALADYDNLVKRLSREREEVIVRANKNLLEDLLPVLDNFERAQSHLNDQGLQMALEQFRKALEKYGVNEIKVEDGADFDAMLHEAIDNKDGGERGKVAEVVAKGFMWRDGTVIKPAKVIVYKGE